MLESRTSIGSAGLQAWPRRLRRKDEQKPNKVFGVVDDQAEGAVMPKSGEQVWPRYAAIRSSHARFLTAPLWNAAGTHSTSPSSEQLLEMMRFGDTRRRAPRAAEGCASVVERRRRFAVGVRHGGRVDCIDLGTTHTSWQTLSCGPSRSGWCAFAHAQSCGRRDTHVVLAEESKVAHTGTDRSTVPWSARPMCLRR